MTTLYDGATGWDWLWSGELGDDFAKYESGNPALMWVVDGLQKYVDDHPDEVLVVAAPGVDRLPFFFPLADITGRRCADTLGRAGRRDLFRR